MRPIRVLLALAVVVAGALMVAPPAQAGGWAVTVLDPLPQRLEPNRPYTIGFWVLQHGSHPVEGDLGRTGLKFVDGGGKVVTFEGVALREPAHFAAAVALPGDASAPSRWTVYGQQGIFEEYEIGTLTLPGGLTQLRPPTPMAMHEDTHWGLIHPPDVAAMAADTTLPENPEAVGYVAAPSPAKALPAAPATAQPAGRRSGQGSTAMGLLSTAAVVWIGLGLIVLGGVVLLGRRWVARTV